MKKQLEEEMAAEIAANQAMLEEQAKSWEDRYKESMAQFSEADVAAKEEEEKRTRIPHLRNVNEDPALSHMVTRFIEGEQALVGRKDSSPPSDIVLGGLSIQREHAVLRSSDEGRTITLEAAAEGAKIMVNGAQISGAVELKNYDSIMFGANHLYYFVNPLTAEAEGAAERKPPTWEDAQEAIARAQGFAPSERTDFASLTQAEQEAILIQDEIVKVLPLVNEANEIASELKRPMAFQVKMVNKLVGDKYKPEVGVIVRSKDSDASWLWSSAKFRNRSFLMRELYQRVQEEGNISVKKEEDPFWEPSEPVLVGVCNVYLAPLSYGVEFDDAVEIRDYKGKAEGIVQISVQPCDAEGKAIAEEDNFIEDASELIGKPLKLLIQVRHARGLNRKFTKGIQCKWSFYDTTYETGVVSGTSNPEFEFSEVYEFARVDKKIVEYLESGLLRVEVWGEQDDGSRQGGGDTTSLGSAASSTDGIKRLAEENSILESRLKEIRTIVEDPANKVPDEAKTKIIAVLEK
jgi:kinesin family protein 1|eukprot:TRINITY_DN164_c1_g2_i1.p2 TRINITY_DN164_c1_g2~~TRINITY_DN164_c1_g2_i1.p2  ORF type:complete len:519 (-),score=310.71 TRINITY_DN164_c1_g2_i1:15-1571(-)